MSYEVLADSLTVHETLSSSTDRDTGETVYEHGNGRVYLKGDVIPDEKVSEITKKLYADGNEHVTSVLKKTDKAPTTEGGATVQDETMGPETGSPGVLKPDVAAQNLNVETGREEAPSEESADEDDGESSTSGAKNAPRTKK